MDQSPPSYGFEAWAGGIDAVCRHVELLAALAIELGMPPADGEAWWGQLFGKLRPQAVREPVLVAAVCGGANTGKSLIATALSGGQFSRSLAESTRTRHPVASVPSALAERVDLTKLFPGFVVRPWTGADDPLVNTTEHRLFVRPETSGRQPSWLVILDTPDIDGSLCDNWERAELVRDAADLIVAVLTQQKYNDAVVRDFFTAAARAGKTLIVVFNMLEWPAQLLRLPGWLASFTSQTGVRSEAVFAIPWDPAAAASLSPSFHEVVADSAVDAAGPLSGDDLLSRMARVDFERIKLAAMRGSLTVVADRIHGLPAWLDRFAATAAAWRRARVLLADEVAVRITLPAVPREIVWNELWQWLEPKRSKLDLAISRVYRIAGRGVAWAGRRAGLLREETAKQADHAAEELSALKAALGDFVDRLEKAASGSPQLLVSLRPVLVEADRQRWFDELTRRHATLPLVSGDFAAFVRDELDRFEREHPGTVRLILTALNVGAVARPAVTVGLGLVGAAAVPPAAAAGGLSVFVHNLGDIVVGAAASLAGESAIGATGVGVRPLLERCFARWAAERADLLAGTIRDVVLGDTLALIESRAASGERAELETVRRLVEELAADLPATAREEDR